MFTNNIEKGDHKFTWSPLNMTKNYLNFIYLSFKALTKDK